MIFFFKAYDFNSEFPTESTSQFVLLPLDICISVVVHEVIYFLIFLLGIYDSRSNYPQHYFLPNLPACDAQNIAEYFKTKKVFQFASVTGIRFLDDKSKMAESLSGFYLMAWWNYWVFDDNRKEICVDSVPESQQSHNDYKI